MRADNWECTADNSGYGSGHDGVDRQICIPRSQYRGIKGVLYPHRGWQTNAMRVKGGYSRYASISSMRSLLHTPVPAMCWCNFRPRKHLNSDACRTGIIRQVSVRSWFHLKTYQFFTRPFSTVYTSYFEENSACLHQNYKTTTLFFSSLNQENARC